MFQRAGYFGQLHLLAVELSESDAEAVAASVGALEGKVAEVSASQPSIKLSSADSTPPIKISCCPSSRC